MRVSLIKNDKITSLILPTVLKGNYWITEPDEQGNDKNLISIEAVNNNWRLFSNSDVSLVLNGASVPYTDLKLYNFYVLEQNNGVYNKKQMILYCSPVYDSSYNYYSIDGKNIDIGSSSGNDISFASSNLQKHHATIKPEKNNFVFVPKAISYINNVLVNKEQILTNGDVIFLMGLKIVFIIRDNNFYLQVNNPNNNVSVKLNLANLNNDLDKEFVEPEEELDIRLYDEDDSFHKKPRFIRRVETLNLNIDNPPGKPGENQDRPWLLTVGPMLSMSMMSVMSVYTAINNITMNNMPLSRAMPSLVMAGAMLCGTFVWPSINRRYEKSRMKKMEKMRQAKYKKYIEDKRKEIQDEIVKQRNILIDNFPTTLECQNIILTKMTRLWERRLGDDDFLTVNLGIGNKDMDINIKYPEKHFTMEEDNLIVKARELGEEPKLIQSVSIDLSLLNNNILGIVGNELQTSNFMSQLLLQIMAFHSYDDLKIVMLTNKDNEHYWQYLKILPHIFSNNREFRFYGEDSDDYKEISYVLDKEFAERNSQENEDVMYKPYYLIITDNFKSVRNYDVIKKILNAKNNKGFSLVILTEKITNIPDQCKSFVNMYQEKAELYINKVNNKAQVFAVDYNDNYRYYDCAKMLANIHIDINSETEGRIPKKVGFLEMYDVGRIEQINAQNRWKKNNPILSLAAPVGIGKSGEKIVLDLHEKYHGPHGLIAGMTGSGKSEFIITYIISLALNYHPYEVQFILIDYKGGGLAGAFENKNIDLKLPHLVGTITNLDANEIKRSLASIESELKRRQKLFNLAREKTNESTVDIYKYQKMFRNGIVDEPISHLFIISDEFAELKNQQPEFMQQLISTARIGRSLGVHLILATQKPSGVVDPQIWSNTRFRVCLRVQEKSDSTEVIKKPDAALLKQTGRFYFQVGFDEIFVLGQAAWCGGQYVPSEKIKKELDTSVNFIDNIGYIVKSTETRKKAETGPSQGEELINLVKYLSDIAKEEKISCRPLWLEKIPAVIFVNNLIQKYKYNKESFIINPVVGELDNPNMQMQHLLTMPISKEGNTLVYGSAGSGKENFIMTILYSSMITYTPKEVNYYIIDFGSEALNSFKKAPIVGDILHMDDVDKITNLYKMLIKQIDNRKKIFADYNGDYLTYCKNSGNTVPTIITIINNFEAYSESNEKHEEILNVLTRDGSKYGINFIFTVNTPNGVKFKLRQNFNQNFVLQQNNEDDYSVILGNVRKNYPSKIFGRGIIKKDDIFEFQTAFVCEKDKIQEYIKALAIKQIPVLNDKAKSVPILPKVVSYEHIKDELGKDKDIIIGISKAELDIVKFDFRKTMINVVTATDLLSTYNFIKPFINQLLYLNNSKVIFINAEDYELEDNYSKYIEYYHNNFDNFFQEFYKYIMDKHAEYVNNKYNNSIFEKEQSRTVIILGFSNFTSKLSLDNKRKVSVIFEKAKDLDLINFVFIDSIDKIRKLEMEPWFKGSSNTSEGIWIGSGINDQFTLRVTQRSPETKEVINDEFCFVLKRGKPLLVKYVANLDINLEGK